MFPVLKHHFAKKTYKLKHEPETLVYTHLFPVYLDVHHIYVETSCNLSSSCALKNTNWLYGQYFCNVNYWHMCHSDTYLLPMDRLITYSYICVYMYVIYVYISYIVKYFYCTCFILSTWIIIVWILSFQPNICVSLHKVIKNFHFHMCSYEILYIYLFK